MCPHTTNISVLILLYIYCVCFGAGDFAIMFDTDDFQDRSEHCARVGLLRSLIDPSRALIDP